MSDSIITLAILGGAGFLLWQSFSQKPFDVESPYSSEEGVRSSNGGRNKKRQVYDPRILFTAEMLTDKGKNQFYWRNRKLDKAYVDGEAVRYSPESIKKGIGQRPLRDAEYFKSLNSTGTYTHDGFFDLQQHPKQYTPQEIQRGFQEAAQPDPYMH